MKRILPEGVPACAPGFCANAETCKWRGGEYACGPSVVKERDRLLSENMELRQKYGHFMDNRRGREAFRKGTPLSEVSGENAVSGWLRAEQKQKEDKYLQDRLAMALTQSNRLIMQNNFLRERIVAFASAPRHSRDEAFRSLCNAVHHKAGSRSEPTASPYGKAETEVDVEAERLERLLMSCGIDIGEASRRRVLRDLALLNILDRERGGENG
jgi:hypothetical protein